MQGTVWDGMSENLLRNDIAVVKFDYEGKGDSEGAFKDITPFGALKDLRQVVEIVKAHENIQSNNINMLGSSFGGFLGLLYTSNYECINLLGLKSPASDYARIRRTQFGKKGIQEWQKNGYTFLNDIETCYDFFVEIQSIDMFGLLVEQIKSKVLIVHGDKDENVPIDQSIRLNKLLKNSELSIFKGVGHRYLEPGAKQKLVEIFSKWFVSNINKN